MSRVDDDRDAARIAQRLAEAKKAEESKKSQKASQDNAFSKLVAGQQQQAQAKTKQTQESANTARSAIAQMLESAGETRQGEQTAYANRDAASRTAARMGGKQTDEKVKQQGASAGEQAMAAKNTGDAETQLNAAGRNADTASASAGRESRASDAKSYNSHLEEKKEASDSSNASRAGGSARSEKGDLKTDADKGGGGQQQGGEKKGESAAAPSFRFNPALQAPVTVAKPKENTGSDRLRRIASEIAQKIVEKVRVGTNAAGKMEMQIDLRSDVLSGMSVKISAKNGKISAVFQGNDKDVLKMIEEQKEQLTATLKSRGLTLEDFKVEAKT